MQRASVSSSVLASDKCSAIDEALFVRGQEKVQRILVGIAKERTKYLGSVVKTILVVMHSCLYTEPCCAHIFPNLDVRCIQPMRRSPAADSA